MDRKNLIALVLSSLLGASQVQAQRTPTTSPKKETTTQIFKNLWKEVVQHHYNDLPQSALSVVKTIRQKAEETNNAPHLIAAMLSAYQLEKVISPDSTQRVREEMEAFCAAETRTVPSALWHYTLALIMHDEISNRYFDDEEYDDYADEDDEVGDGECDENEHKTGNKVENAEDAVDAGEIKEASGKKQSPKMRTRKHFRAAFEHLPELAAAKVEDYKILFDASRKSTKIVDHSLLVVLLQDLFDIEDQNSDRPFSAPEYIALLEKSRDLFLQNHKEHAALQTEILLLRMKGGKHLRYFTPTFSYSYYGKTDETETVFFPSRDAALEAVEKVLARYGHLPEAGEVALLQCELMAKDEEHFQSQMPKALALAKEYTKKYADFAQGFKKFVQEKTHPKFEISWDNTSKLNSGSPLYPETEVIFPVKFRNVQNASLRLYRLNNISATELEKVHDKEKVQEKLQKILKKHGERTPVLTKMFCPAAAPAYEYREDSLRFQAPQSGLYMMRLSVDGWYDELAPCFVSRGKRLVFHSASRHQDAPEFLVIDQRSGEEITNKADLDALPEFAKLTDWLKLSHTRLDLNLEHNITVYTDREIYRPSQKVEASALLYTQEGDIYKVLPNARVRARLIDTNYQEVKTQILTSDNMGVVQSQFTLPKYCKPGEFSVEFALVDDNNNPYPVKETKYFRVEEYKRPNFSVKLDGFTRKLALTDSVNFEGVAETFAGIPVANAVLKWKLNFDSWYFYHSRNKGGVDRSLKNRSGETKTDKNGRFSIPQEWAFEDESSLSLNLSVEVVAPDGEVQSTGFSQWISPRTEQEEEEKPQKPLFEVTHNETEDEAKLTINGSGRLFLRLVSTNRGVIERKTIDIKDGYTQTFQWREEDNLGDAVTAYLYLLKDGEFHTETITVSRPRPDKRLQLSWSTFRSQLTPGQSEEWQLRVTNPDGTPANANVVARLYDASLDALLNTANKDPWKFQYSFPRETPSADWYQPQVWSMNFFPYFKGKSYYQYPLPSVSWCEGLFGYRSWDEQIGCNPIRCYSMDSVVSSMDDPWLMETTEIKSAMAPDKLGADSSTSSTPVRQNFNETAYFNPTLRTNADGRATLRFVLPESLTEWTFNAFAFDRALNSGTLTDKVVARKLLNTQVATPRFLREGDKMQWPVSLYNRSEQLLKGKLLLEILDAASHKVLKSFTRSFDLEAGKSLNQVWEWEVPEASAPILVRAVAKSPAFSDGEEHEIPILPRNISLTVAQPFVVRSQEDKNTIVEKAKADLQERLGQHKEAKIEVVADRNSYDEVAELVPQWMQVVEGSSYDQAVNLYAIQCAMTPALRPLISLSDSEIRAYGQSAFDRLKAKQTAEGGWSWFTGMAASPYITSQIAILLARTEVLHHQKDFNRQLLEPALKFLDQKMKQQMLENKKKNWKPYVGETECNYLYLCHLLQRKETPTLRYWLDAMGKDDKHPYTMYGKAVQSQVFASTKYDELAQIALQSLIEHTVVSPEMGRYFDTQRALSGYASYRIPTQVMTLEALAKASEAACQRLPLGRQQITEEMQLWLLQSKHTQVWNNSRATTDAAYSLLSSLETSLHGMSWGAVSATYTATPEEITAQGSGFQIERSLQVLHDGKWKTLSVKNNQTSQVLKVGDHVRWVYTLKADRDFDHVCLKSARPAAFESKHPFSGMTWMNDLHAYRMVRDTENEYFFEHLPKGEYRFDDEMVVIRSGEFSGGISTVQCTFAPEFIAHSSALDVLVKR